MSTRSPEAERAALEDLIASEGWAILKALVEHHYNAESQLRDIDLAFKAYPPSEAEATQAVVVPQIIASAKAANGVLDLPASRLRQLPTTPKASKDAFAPFRRAGR